MNIKISIDMMRPDKMFVLKWLRPDQRAALAQMVMQAKYDDLIRLVGEGGGNDNEE